MRIPILGSEGVNVRAELYHDLLDLQIKVSEKRCSVHASVLVTSHHQKDHENTDVNSNAKQKSEEPNDFSKGKCLILP